MTIAVFDEIGRVWDPHSYEFAHHLSSCIGAKTLCDYAARNLGYIVVEVCKTSAHIRFRPAFATFPAVHALLNWLNKQHVERVALSTFHSEWRHELLPPSQAAVVVQALGRRLRAEAPDAAALSA